MRINFDYEACVNAIETQVLTLASAAVSMRGMVKFDMELQSDAGNVTPTYYVRFRFGKDSRTNGISFEADEVEKAIKTYVKYASRL